MAAGAENVQTFDEYGIANKDSRGKPFGYLVPRKNSVNRKFLMEKYNPDDE